MKISDGKCIQIENDTGRKNINYYFEEKFHDWSQPTPNM